MPFDLAKSMRIAVIGSGISGHGAALALHGFGGISVTVYEELPRIGGHANTISVNYGATRIAVDTGFIVYNELNYPNYTAMLDWAQIKTIASDMSFSLSVDDGAFEWCGRHVSPLGGLFSQKSNALDPGFYRFLLGIRSFQKRAIADAEAGRIDDVSLGAYLENIGCHPRVRDDYVVPMGAAIWSMTPGEILAFPAKSFMAFFNNHKLLQWDRPTWRTVHGGSRMYVEALQRKLGHEIRASTGVLMLETGGEAPIIRDTSGNSDIFDAVIVATSAPRALQLLATPDQETRAVLSSFRVSQNHVVVHCDPALMPKRKAAWASWNLLRRTGSDKSAVTYWMNRLQSIPESHPLFVTLNPDRPIREDLVFSHIDYEHPVYDAAAIAAQDRLHSIQGRKGVYFAGAWTGYGFHEDGLRSGLEAARRLGGVAPWLR